MPARLFCSPLKQDGLVNCFSPQDAAKWYCVNSRLGLKKPAGCFFHPFGALSHFGRRSDYRDWLHNLQGQM